MGFKLSQEKTDAILADLRNEVSYNEIKEKHTVSLWTVNDIATKNNIVRSKGVKKGYRLLSGRARMEELGRKEFVKQEDSHYRFKGRYSNSDNFIYSAF